MKYLFLSLILFLTSCSLSKDSAYWNENPIKKSTEDKKLSKILEKKGDYKSMTFDEFNLFTCLKFNIFFFSVKFI